MRDINELDLQLLFPKDVQSAVEIQNNLSKSLKIQELETQKIQYIGGLDVSYLDKYALGVLVILDNELNIVDIISQKAGVEFPYIPGFLAFREAPVILECLRKSSIKPDVLIFDGQGIVHPRGFGIASHIGVLLDVPSIGVAKSRLYGVCDKPTRVGQAEPIYDEVGNLIGYCYLSKRNTNPIYISPGHLCDPDSALSFVKSLIRGYKLPEPTRLAHIYTQRLKSTEE
ncbi:MAG TPA: endonuclease V [Fervidobacterium sp.]|nr:endonuclease V [Fervidobacterium sp.]MBP8656918.1 endonuclease V [Fervidobacterium sp.]HCL99288.1 endonuclease V [Fervidobacterium sp.]HON04531.1 endonuclease V [Fervidobacterium sp.]HOV53158.1 endonuclease V [Fervidobacterium sp.]